MFFQLFLQVVLVCFLLFVDHACGSTEEDIIATRASLYALHLGLSISAQFFSARFESQEVRKRVFAKELTQAYRNTILEGNAAAIMPPVFHNKDMHAAIENRHTFFPVPCKGLITIMAWIPGFPCGAFVVMSPRAFERALHISKEFDSPILTNFLPHTPLPDSVLHEARPDLISPINNKIQSATLPQVENVILLLKFISTQSNMFKDKDDMHQCFSHFFLLPATSLSPYCAMATAAL